MAEIDFNESHHGCLVGFFYDELKRAFSKRSIAAFKKAAQIYGEQRGGRMALRALRDGQDLSYNSYFHYREWPLTQDFFKIEQSVTDGVMLTETFVCPWHAAFKELGLLECGTVYCEQIDASLVRGFNPDLKFEVLTLLHTGDSCRLHFHLDVPLKKLEEAGAPVILDMEYHCAHLFWTFADVTKSIFGDKSLSVIENVIRRFSERFGQERREVLEAYQDCNFVRLPEGEERYAKNVVR